MSRAVRSLENLENTASTARVLNLRAIAVRFHRDPEYIARPLFRNASLNKAIILKHRLRRHEHEEFHGYRHSATKILLPIETLDLRMGARYLFVGQKNFNDLLEATFGISLESGDPDARTLTILDNTPSLDPFLLREQLRMQGVDAAPCYFDISEADMNRMFDFAQTEVQQLVEMSFSGGDVQSGSGISLQAGKLARKILLNAKDSDLEPLRLTMQLSQQQYQEGIFCWKAFLYYKWRLRNVMPELKDVMGQLETVKPKGSMSPDTKTYLVEAKASIRKAVVASCRKVQETLAIYDNAYEGLTRRGDPLGFREFLLQAPAMFNDLGERLGGVDHIISFWRFRFPHGARSAISPEELTEIFSDFEQSLGIESRGEILRT